MLEGGWLMGVSCWRLVDAVAGIFVVLKRIVEMI